MQKRIFGVWLPGFILALLLAAAWANGVIAQGGDGFAAQLKARAWADADARLVSLLPRLTVAPAAGQALTRSSAEGLRSQIVFQSYRDGNWEIYMMDPDGGNQRRLTHHEASDTDPRLHPDLLKIVFVSKRDGRSQIYSMNPDGSDLVRLSDPGWDEAYPAWSPNGGRIVFSRKKDRWGLFVMQADGSDARRLTKADDADDISPAWSPDGSKIAWIRRRAGGYGDVMIMDSYGGNQRVLVSKLRFAQNLVWAPDGQHLALDYDYNGDDWNDLVVISVSGSRRVIRQSPAPLVDLWLGSWSPDSDFLLYTRVNYVVQDNKLYIAETRLRKVEAREFPDDPIGFPDTGLDMSPHWQRGIDRQPPQVSIQPLPAVSPSPFMVSWSGVDVGRAGLDSFDVQVRKDDGPWQAWYNGIPSTGIVYAGLGGHQYTFRVRAKDTVGNISPWTDTTMTTIEDKPPHAEFTYLPRYFFNGGDIGWQGTDEGGSGVNFYRVEYREAQSDQWSLLVDKTRFTQGRFYSFDLSKSYYFRIRATDYAWNTEAWDDVGEGPLTPYGWGVDGRITDNRDRPLAGVTVTSAPQAEENSVSDENGDYFLYTNQWSQEGYAVNWSFPGLGSPPETRYDNSLPGHTDVVMPPPDDVVQDGSFEETTASAWQTAGHYPPQRVSAFHTGGAAMRLGARIGGDNVERIQTSNDAYRLQVQKDDQDRLHLLWDEGRNPSRYILKYAQLNPDGSVAEVREIGTAEWGLGYRHLAVSPAGHAFIVWLSPDMDHHYALIHRSPDGVWSEPLDLQQKGRVFVAADAQNTLHIYNYDGIYLRCTASGACSQPEEMTAAGYAQAMHVMADGSVYFVWTSRWHGNPQVFYQFRHADGRWDEPKAVPGSNKMLFIRPMSLMVDDQGVMHFIAKAGGMVYTRLEPNGRWLQRQLPLNDYAVFPASDHRVHIIGVLGRYGIFSFRYLRLEPDGRWSIDEDQKIPPEVAKKVFSASRYQFTMDSQGRIYAVGFGDRVHVAVRELDGRWRYWAPFGQSCSMYDSNERDRAVLPLVDSRDILRLVWPGASPNCDVFAFNAAAPETGDSLLRQQITIPSDMNEPTLSFFYQLEKWPDSPSQLQVTVESGGQTTPVFTAEQFEGAWRHAWVDMSRWKGQTVTVAFDVSQQAGSAGSRAFVDDVSLGTGAYPDLWTTAPAVAPRPNDARIAFDIFYGNRGEATARDTRVTVTLPAGAAFISADPPPSGRQGDQAWWDIAELPPMTGPLSIHLTTAMPAGAAAGDILSGVAAISTSSTELDAGDNQAEVLIFVGGWQGHLPLLMR